MLKKRAITIILIFLCCQSIMFGQMKSESPCLVENVVLNSDFTSGNTNFTSQLPFSGTCAANSYIITTSLSNKCSGWPNVPDHTQNGVSPANYMAVDGNPYTNMVDIWRQTVNVCAGNTYTFSFWTYSVYSQTFTVGMCVDTSKTDVTINIGGWTQHSRTWNATASGTVSIALIQNVGSHYCDFGIDDISFSSCVCESTVGIFGDDKNEPHITLYPNPTFGIFHIECSYKSTYSVVVYDLIGNCLMTKMASKIDCDIDLSHIDKGIYFIEIIADRKRIVKKVVLE
ncbi:MAG: T9SS type A sorting domain-containing protein [Bacteroidetes bacterium]|nr:T9SS type A sorting domain-containing protein [Bacteroidota bacterium]